MFGAFSKQLLEHFQKLKSILKEVKSKVAEERAIKRLKLIESFSVDKSGYVREWKLKTVDFNKNTKDFFTKRQNYQSTDYADIGDDHTDPFLTKMVTQGFIEAGASGYYDEHGHSIGEGHSH